MLFRQVFALWRLLLVLVIEGIHAAHQPSQSGQHGGSGEGSEGMLPPPHPSPLHQSPPGPPGHPLLLHPRLARVCQGLLPSHSFSADVPGYRLTKAAFLLAPGHLASHHHIGDLSPPHLSCHYGNYLHGNNTAKQQSFLEALQIRHHLGPSTEGLKVFSQVPSSQTCSDGDLTPLGAAALISLGEKLREVYGDKLKALSKLPKDYSFLAYTLPSESAFQGSLSFLHGLLSEKQFSRMHLKKGANHFCGKKHGALCSCLQKSSEGHEWAEQYRKGHMIHKSAPGPLPFTEDIAFDADVSAKHLLQILSSWICHKREVPCRNGHCPDISLPFLDSLFEQVDSHSSSFSGSPHFQSLALLQSSSFLQDLAAWLAADKAGQDATLYAGDDLFMLKVLSALGVPLDQVLLPGSWVVFESYRNMAVSASAAYVRIVVNGEVVTDKVEACHGATKHGLCKVKHIQQFLMQRLSQMSADKNAVGRECLEKM